MKPRTGCLAVVIACAAHAIAQAHGGLPVSLRVLTRPNEARLFVPVVFWGLWVTDDSNQWRFICEEAINTNRFRRYGLLGDGTLVATDNRGLTVSHDGGCSWANTTSLPLARLRTSDIEVVPSSPSMAFVAAAQSIDDSVDAGADAFDGGLFVTRDGARTFERVPALGRHGQRQFLSVRVAEHAALTIATSSVAGSRLSPPILHLSRDGGTTFEDHEIAYLLDGQQLDRVDVLAVDPRSPDVIYLRASNSGGSRQALLRTTDGGVTVTELATAAGVVNASGYARGIDSVSINWNDGAVYVATPTGILSGVAVSPTAPLTLTPSFGFSQTQCVEQSGEALFVCSTNYSPDFAAVARATKTNGATPSFSSILSYQDTKGPLECPAGTGVATLCPDVWLRYAVELGIDNVLARPDAGTTPAPAGGGCACTIGARQPASTTVFAFSSIALSIVCVRLLRSRTKQCQQRGR